MSVNTLGLKHMKVLFQPAIPSAQGPLFRQGVREPSKGECGHREAHARGRRDVIGGGMKRQKCGGIVQREVYKANVQHLYNQR